MKGALLLLFLTVNTVYTWNSCGDESFCDTIRNNDTETNFVLDADSLSYDTDGLEAVLTNTGSEETFSLSITGFESEIFRITIDDPDNPRYTVPLVVDDGLDQASITVTEGTDNVQITNGDSYLLVEYSPFKVSVYKDDDLILIINDHNRMVFNSEEDDLAIAVDFTFPAATVAYGIPLHADHLALQETGPGGLDPYRLYNVDHCCYDNFIQDSLYGSEPVLYAHGVNRTTGMFWLNAAQTFVDISKENDQIQSLFISESGVIDIFVLPGPTFNAAVTQYTTVTGVAPLPQYFTLGYHQSRWSYQTQEEAETVIREFDNNDFPMDAIWFDVDYMNESKSFTWNYTAFPDPIAMQDYMDSTGRKLVLIIHPHFSTDEGYFVYDTSVANDYFVKYDNGTIFTGEGWPGPNSAWMDFTNPEAVSYFASLYRDNFPDTTDIVYIWNDMNEPEVFDGFERSWPRSVIHYGDTPNRDVHNIYSFSQVRATYQGLLARYENTKRPYILSRSHFSGSQRYTIVWTGDNNSTWSHLQISIPMCLSLAISGISHCGADIGGFNGNLTDDLFQRWYQAGAWMPFYRGHSTRYVENREPYLYSEEVQTRFRNAMRQRYAHLPLWYTLFYEHERTGEPVMRPLVYHYPSDVNTYEIEDEWLIGADVLVHPVTEEDATEVRVYLPGGESELWFDMDNNLLYYGLGYATVSVTMDSTPVYYRGGSILSRKETVRSSSVYMHSDPFTLYVFLDVNSEATGTLYIDDNESFNYRNGEYNYYSLQYTGNALSIYNIDSNADYEDGVFTIATIWVYRPPTNYNKAVMNNVEYDISYGPENSYLTVHNLDVSVDREITIEFA